MDGSKNKFIQSPTVMLSDKKQTNVKETKNGIVKTLINAFLHPKINK